MKRGGEEEEKEKVIAFLKSRLFPWNFILEDVEEAPIEHFVPYAMQMCEAKGITNGSVKDGEAKAIIATELRNAMNAYLSDDGNSELREIHGEFAAQYPFAFAQCLVHAILYRLGLVLDDVVNLEAISEVLDLDMEGLKRRERFTRDLISKSKTKAVRVFSKNILDRTVISSEGDSIGNVDDITFDTKTGRVTGLMVIEGSVRRELFMNDIALTGHSNNIVLKHSDSK
ncbi:MAG: PRC-barrel domain-containing protein [Euryarchaeota archaeon]|nr:PRC-barrel domain-containing protein [Euryarchaeota archaeon]